MAKRGPKPLYESPDALRKKIDEYFTIMEEKNEFPDLAGMRLYLRMSEATMKKYQEEDHENYEEYREIFNEAKDRRESFLVRRMTRDNKLAQGCLNALKQPANGGYIDKPQDQGGKMEITLKVAGLKGGVDSLK
jgi:hypothetical protein